MQMKFAGLLALGVALAGAASARAQSVQEIIAIAPGMVMVVPADTQPALPQVITPLPDPLAMMQQMDALMQANLQQAAALPQLPAGNTGSIVITSFSDGTHDCTERVVYPASGSASKIEVSETGNACAGMGAATPAAPVTPASAPVAPLPIPVTAPPVQTGAPLVVADRD